MNAPAPDPLSPDLAPARAVLRAADELRRLAPVRLQADGTDQLILPATPLVNLDALTSRLGPPDVLIPQTRAAILKIRHKGAAAVRLAADPARNRAQLEAIGDAERDLEHPLKGPFAVQPGRPGDEAALALLKLAGLLPAALSWPDADLQSLAADIPQVAADAVQAHTPGPASRLMRVAAARVPVAGAPQARLIAYRPLLGGREHYALVIGDPGTRTEPVLTRLHSECFTGDLLGSLKCDCGDQLKGAIAAIGAAGAGLLLYLAQEGRGIGLVSKLKAYALQDQGFDTVDANLRLGFGVDERLFEPAAAMLRDLGVARVRLMTNNPEKVAGLEAAGIPVAERVAHRFPSNPHNEAYLAVKRDKTGHYL